MARNQGTDTSLCFQTQGKVALLAHHEEAVCLGQVKFIWKKCFLRRREPFPLSSKPRPLSPFRAQERSMQAEWQLGSSGEAASDKKKWRAQGRAPVQRETLPLLQRSITDATAGSGHHGGTTGIWLQSLGKERPRHHTGIFVILSPRSKRGQLHQKRLMLLPDPLMFKLLTCSLWQCLSGWGGWTDHGILQIGKMEEQQAPLLKNSWKNHEPNFPGCRRLCDFGSYLAATWLGCSCASRAMEVHFTLCPRIL